MESGSARTGNLVLLGSSGYPPWNGNPAPIHDQHGRYLCRAEAAVDVADPDAYDTANRDANANDDPHIDPIPNADAVPYPNRDAGASTNNGLVSESYTQSIPLVWYKAN